MKDDQEQQRVTLAEAKRLSPVVTKCSWCGTVIVTEDDHTVMPTADGRISHGICRACYDAWERTRYQEPDQA